MRMGFKKQEREGRWQELAEVSRGRRTGRRFWEVRGATFYCQERPRGMQAKLREEEEGTVRSRQV